MVRHWVIRLVSANLITCWAFQASFGEESVLAEQYDAARSTYAEALSQYQAFDSDTFAEELLRRAGELMIVGEGLYQADDPRMLMLEAAYGYALAESQEYELAREYLTRSLAGLEIALGEKSEEIVNPIISLANANGGLGETSTQVRLYERARKIVDDRYGSSSSQARQLDTIIAEAALSHSSDPSIVSYVNSSLVYQPIERVAPDYPPIALRRRLEGHVDLSFTVTTTGTVRDPVVLKSTNRAFESAAIEAIKKSRYKPRVFDGVPFEVPGVKVRVSFSLPN